MHCYRITTFHPDHPVYVVEGKQDAAFFLARQYTTAHRSPVVALINLPSEKGDILRALRDPQSFIGDAPSLKAWEFYRRGTQSACREIEPNTGDRLRKAVERTSRDAARIKQRVHPSVKAQPSGSWPANTIKR